MPVFMVYQDPIEEYRWRLYGKDKQLLACSGLGYDEQEECLKSIERFKTEGQKAQIIYE